MQSGKTPSEISAMQYQPASKLAKNRITIRYWCKNYGHVSLQTYHGGHLQEVYKKKQVKK